ncbi:MAG: methylenetetrahydrofolate reductase [NAD(P)H] [Zymomonas mobilis subsp. pomaceae]|uniref:Methylenetetrahydrofolate reductase n=1 Tax=Zymomonas mobilis subsp. pomaceae (strain ATCC 29192 / DSM 22645 / JCM 10191 / CCUG 17912 / NBRC 13757 / NCIMB 11200 / NRRL B-4491 / Barker I) TaxID=579138 RepID=F8EV45_ZYMMT|nr:methylenetetrahydrofolate reductase [NAD(P)H] [Zymomonas mobilis]AEI38263.1 5,10-methylenetetrahydrofolate reductase [Zymomonas mobilis subsp. pomaceae ATCC 29192]MDX5947952.1 methylenetetrahydrofolate reductase [NAD(P)H] [Zymomonas mobilis subsp. pomaceae]GEB89281.1 methylenetetrahydrofolate reductase [Zymomonas mobilis subsp. pomaceae]
MDRILKENPNFADVAFLGDKTTNISFEFFPPKNEQSDKMLWQSVERLAPLNPRFMSVTYGAGGTTRERTHATVTRIARETSIPAVAHLTCVNASREEIDEIAQDYWNAGIRHIVALRGDPPGGGRFEARPDGYASAVELVEGLKKIAPFEISVACYPETHPQALSPQADIDFLKRKFDAGATRAISQFFLSPEVFLRFRDRVAAAGITAEILPGIMPTSNISGLKRMAHSCGIEIPERLNQLMDSLDKDDAAIKQMVSMAVVTDLCGRLAKEGVDSFHFYTMNRADITSALCRLLGRQPA